MSSFVLKWETLFICMWGGKYHLFYFSKMLVFTLDSLKYTILTWSPIDFELLELKDTDIVPRRQWEQRMGGLTVWKLHTDVLTVPSKIYCARISNQSGQSTKTDYVDKHDPFERQAGTPLTGLKITNNQSGRSEGGVSERGLGARYHGGSVWERQPLKIAEP